MRRLFLLPATALVTLLLTLLVLNLSLGNKPMQAPPAHAFAPGEAQFLRSTAGVLASPWVPGNQVRTLINGVEIFPPMLAAIGRARHTICLETYIYWQGDVGAAFAAALEQAARRGVRVHLLLDWIGGRLDKAQLQRMRGAGVRLRRYNSPHWYNLGRLNNRTHRKLLVIDGEVGFIGGANIADKWSGNAQDPQHWRGTHFQVEGPVVAQLQATFDDNWLQATGELLQGDAYFPPLQPAGGELAQVFAASPGDGSHSMQAMYLVGIAAAVRSIELSAAYFVPDEVATRALVAALRRGVRLRILLPGPHMDVPLVRRASRARWGPLLEAGAEIYEYQPTMFHCKVMVVDRLWVSVGSTNFDPRSFAVNDEVNMNVHGAAFAEHQVQVFEHDLRSAERITLQQWRQRPWIDKLADDAASLLGSQL